MPFSGPNGFISESISALTNLQFLCARALVDAAPPRCISREHAPVIE